MLEGSAYKGGTIVVVDDNQAAVNGLATILAAHGFQNVKGITDPQHALKDLRNGSCDLLILDLHMPGMSGLDLLLELKKTVPEEEMFPVLILTGDTDAGLRDTLLAAGTMDYVTKPFNRREIIHRVGNLLRMRYLHNQVRGHAASLEDRVQQRTQELHDAYLDTVYCLAQAAEFRDDNTGQHIARVGSTAAAIAKHIPEAAPIADSIKHAAQLHDIGKIGLPDAILLKPGKLTDEEYEAMKAHAVIGERILQKSPSALLQLASVIAVSHHERWDGKGYPYGLEGDQIPLPGRITAVADVFDALITERPYKRAWTEEEALKELLAQRGRMFDPAVVDTFVEKVIGEQTQTEAVHA